MQNVRLLKFGMLQRVWRHFTPLCIAGFIAFAGVVAMIEMLYHRALDADSGPVMTLFAWQVDTSAAMPWALAVLLVIVGALGVRWLGRGFQSVWSDVNTEIEEAMRRAAA
jgi:branched-chain amino acid transport system permease protein